MSSVVKHGWSPYCTMTKMTIFNGRPNFVFCYLLSGVALGGLGSYSTSSEHAILPLEGEELFSDVFWQL